jgi:hypothetical protein
MHVYKAHVKDGRIELDEPADLPEGAELQITLVLDDDEMSAEERERLHAAIRRGLAEDPAGDMDMDDFLAELESNP